MKTNLSFEKKLLRNSEQNVIFFQICMPSQNIWTLIWCYEVMSKKKKKKKDGPNLCRLLGISELQRLLLAHLKKFCEFLSQKNMAKIESNAWLKSQIMTLLKIQMHFFFFIPCDALSKILYYGCIIKIL